MHPELLLLELHSKPALLFLIAEKDPVGRTLRATPCRPYPAGHPLRAAFAKS